MRRVPVGDQSRVEEGGPPYPLRSTPSVVSWIERPSAGERIQILWPSDRAIHRASGEGLSAGFRGGGGAAGPTGATAYVERSSCQRRSARSNKADFSSGERVNVLNGRP